MSDVQYELWDPSEDPAIIVHASVAKSNSETPRKPAGKWRPSISSGGASLPVVRSNGRDASGAADVHEWIVQQASDSDLEASIQGVTMNSLQHTLGLLRRSLLVAESMPRSTSLGITGKSDIRPARLKYADDGFSRTGASESPPPQSVPQKDLDSLKISPRKQQVPLDAAGSETGEEATPAATSSFDASFIRCIDQLLLIQYERLGRQDISLLERDSRSDLLCEFHQEHRLMWMQENEGRMEHLRILIEMALQREETRASDLYSAISEYEAHQREILQSEGAEQLRVLQTHISQAWQMTLQSEHRNQIMQVMMQERNERFALSAYEASRHDSIMRLFEQEISNYNLASCIVPLEQIAPPLRPRSHWQAYATESAPTVSRGTEAEWEVSITPMYPSSPLNTVRSASPPKAKTKRSGSTNSGYNVRNVRTTRTVPFEVASEAVVSAAPTLRCSPSDASTQTEVCALDGTWKIVRPCDEPPIEIPPPAAPPAAVQPVTPPKSPEPKRQATSPISPKHQRSVEEASVGGDAELQSELGTAVAAVPPVHPDYEENLLRVLAAVERAAQASSNTKQHHFEQPQETPRLPTRNLPSFRTARGYMLKSTGLFTTWVQRYFQFTESGELLYTSKDPARMHLGSEESNRWLRLLRAEDILRVEGGTPPGFGNSANLPRGLTPSSSFYVTIASGNSGSRKKNGTTSTHARRYPAHTPTDRVEIVWFGCLSRKEVSVWVATLRHATDVVVAMQRQQLEAGESRSESRAAASDEGDLITTVQQPQQQQQRHHQQHVHSRGASVATTSIMTDVTDDILSQLIPLNAEQRRKLFETYRTRVQIEESVSALRAHQAHGRLPSPSVSRDGGKRLKSSESHESEEPVGMLNGGYVVDVEDDSARNNVDLHAVEGGQSLLSPKAEPENTLPYHASTNLHGP